MAEPARAWELLRRARAVYDAPACPLAALAGQSWRGGFAAGGRWMQQTQAHLREGTPAGSIRGLNALGAIKYALAGTAALFVAVPAVLLHLWPLLVVCVPAFYAVESQMVFLFPLAIDGSAHPFREARCWTVRAGGTLSVMAVVLPLAGVMIFGGLVRQGFVRSWCLGCLAVCIWYEDLRTAAS